MTLYNDLLETIQDFVVERDVRSLNNAESVYSEVYYDLLAVIGEFEKRGQLLIEEIAREQEDEVGDVGRPMCYMCTRV